MLKAIAVSGFLLLLAGPSYPQQPTPLPAQNQRAQEQENGTPTRQQPSKDQTSAHQPSAPVQTSAAARADDNPQQREPTTTQKQPDDWWAGLGVGDKIAFIAAFMAFLQFIALMATVYVMRNSVHRQLRAYISGRPNFAVAFGPATFSGARVELQNVGSTPAHGMIHRSIIDVFQYPLPENFQFPKLTGKFAHPVTLFPTLPFKGAVWATRIFTAVEIAAIRAGASRVYVYGEIRYHDSFKKFRSFKPRRWTTYAVSITADAPTLVKLTSDYAASDLEVTFEAAPTGNNAD